MGDVMISMYFPGPSIFIQFRYSIVENLHDDIFYENYMSNLAELNLLSISS